MLQFKDFFPNKTQKASLLKTAKYEDFATIVDRANQWLGDNPRFQMINVETLLIPVSQFMMEEFEGEAGVIIAQNASHKLQQCLRVWYKMAE
ncbi:MAG: hypothetical protein AAF206_10275 [Bacteroidota bacterium]